MTTKPSRGRRWGVILVDHPRECGAPWPGGVACHLGTSDGNLDELHAFAARIGVPRRWFQPSNHPLRAHYDLSPRRYRTAVACGARMIDTREWARQRIEKIRAQRHAAPEGTSDREVTP